MACVEEEFVLLFVVVNFIPNLSRGDETQKKNKTINKNNNLLDLYIYIIIVAICLF